ncbi:uncharacterized protein KY384_002882 [Bacidia gigantensis]|uniref:uncharacterized protein n=1 Tax=Bacidia gigantensis TaxID=2732470 RepID=UPI001D055B45|nr:uncharacterized protein KY384_002882 [Bacidia gigantensis]KAG8532397.1 hypothetical protein KY384_002882 [Bacidia gigantensis]
MGFPFDHLQVAYTWTKARLENLVFTEGNQRDFGWRVHWIQDLREFLWICFFAFYAFHWALLMIYAFSISFCIWGLCGIPGIDTFSPGSATVPPPQNLSIVPPSSDFSRFLLVAHEELRSLGMDVHGLKGNLNRAPFETPVVNSETIKGLAKFSNRTLSFATPISKYSSGVCRLMDTLTLDTSSFLGVVSAYKDWENCTNTAYCTTSYSTSFFFPLYEIACIVNSHLHISWLPTYAPSRYRVQRKIRYEFQRFYPRQMKQLRVLQQFAEHEYPAFRAQVGKLVFDSQADITSSLMPLEDHVREIYYYLGPRQYMPFLYPQSVTDRLQDITELKKHYKDIGFAVGV